MVATSVSMLILKRRPLVALGMIGLLLILAVAAIGLLWRWRPSLTGEEVRAQIVTTLQREARASFLVTGTLDIVATTTVTNTRTVLPGLLDMSLGTTRVTVQVPGRVHYGFDVRTIKARDIEIDEAGVVTMNIPAPVVYTVEPNLSDLRVWTDKGWARGQTSVQKAERRALTTINEALTKQARAHIAGSTQPHINTAHALEQMLTPALKSAGVEKPAFRFRVGQRLVLEPAS